MPNLLIALLIGSAPAFATVGDFKFEVRGPQTCVADATPERCYKTLDLGEGLDILKQLTKYEASVDDEGNPRANVQLSLDDVRGMAAGTGLSPDGRRTTVDRFATLNVTRIASDIETASTEAHEAHFLAEIKWAEKAEPAVMNVTLVEGRVVSADKEIDLSNMNATEVNETLSKLVQIDRVSAAGLDQDFIRGTIAPAVLANEYVAAFSSLIDQLGKALGEAINGVFTEIFGHGKAEAPAQP